MSVQDPPRSPDAVPATATPHYAERLRRLQGARWKRLLDVQAPYRWHIRSLKLGRVLDLGCGVGRSLAHLGAGAVGIDHNRAAVAIARARGFIAYENAEWPAAPEAKDGPFDAILIAHVLEHLDEADGVRLVREHLRYLSPHGSVVFITPQERGYRSDATHVRFVGFQEVGRLCAALGLVPDLRRSFPFPRLFGHRFKYNEFVVVARRA